VRAAMAGKVAKAAVAKAARAGKAAPVVRAAAAGT